MPTPFGPGCWQAFFLPEDEPAHDEVESTPDSLDSRMQQTWYVNGTLWGSSGTAVRVNGELKAGIAWFAVSPKINGAKYQRGVGVFADSDLRYSLDGNYQRLITDVGVDDKVGVNGSVISSA